MFEELESSIVVFTDKKLKKNMFKHRIPIISISHGFNCSWLWHATSSSAPDAKKTLKMKKVPKRAKTVKKNTQKVLQSAHINRVSVSRMSVSSLPSSRLMSARSAAKF